MTNYLNQEKNIWNLTIQNMEKLKKSLQKVQFYKAQNMRISEKFNSQYMNQLEIKFSNSTLDSKISTDITKIEKILENEPKKEEDGTMQFMKNLDYY